jgi:hypothetical protein
MLTLALLLILNTAQIDPKMRLDLDIAENILTELLKQNGAPTSFVKGSHIPGYGVMLELSYRHLSVRMVGLGLLVTGVQIDELIQRYLNDYGDLITGIGPDESISVTYSSRMSASKTLVSVKKRDVADRRSGKITEAVFNSRIRTQQIDPAPDAEIFAKVVETAVNADTSRTFSIRNVTSSSLPGFGLLVSGTLSGGLLAPGAPVAFTFTTEGGELPELVEGMAPEMIERIEVLRKDSSNTEAEVRVMVDAGRPQIDGIREEVTMLRNSVNRIQGRRMRSKEDLAAAYVSLETQLKSVILDYGRTLGSLKAGETLMVRIDNDRAPEGLPKSMTFTVAKSVLNDFDRRSITKEQASAKIVVVKE